MVNGIIKRHRSWTFRAATLSLILFYYVTADVCAVRVFFCFYCSYSFITVAPDRSIPQSPPAAKGHVVHYGIRCSINNESRTIKKRFFFFNPRNLITSKTLTKKNQREQISLWGPPHELMTVRTGRSHHLSDGFKGWGWEIFCPHRKSLPSTLSPPTNKKWQMNLQSFHVRGCGITG